MTTPAESPLAPLRLRSLPAGVKLGVTGLLITLLMGMAASAMHLYWHYEPRDERPGLSRDDIAGAYRGVHSPSPLVAALERGHPEGLDAESKDALLAWLRGDRIGETYDSFDLGDLAPAEIMATSCIFCHSRRPTAGDAAAGAAPLDYWDDVSKLAFSRRIEPTPLKKVTLSIHAHALSLGAMSLVLAGMAALTSLPRRLMGGLVLLTGLALAVDIAAWLLARVHERFVDVIIGAGAVYNGGTVLLIALIMLDLWLPRSREERA